MSGRARDGAGGAAQAGAPRQNEYFVPRDGIDREVITADICRYLGNDALVRPGTYTDPATGQLMQGYRVTAYRALTSAMIQDLKNDSARWEQERRSHSGPSGARYSDSSSRFSSGSAPAQYPGNDAPGYSGGGSGTGSGPGYQYDNRQSGYGNPPYPPQGQAFPTPAQGDRYGGQGQPAPGGAYPPQPYGTAVYSQEAGGAPYVDVGANRHYQDPRMTGAGYPTQAQGGVYYSPGQYQAGHAAQPVDPMYGRGNNYPTSQADYSSSSAQPVYQYDPSSQFETASQTPLPRATTSSPTSTQAQTGHSGSSHSHRHRDRDTRDGSYSKSERHRRPQ